MHFFYAVGWTVVLIGLLLDGSACAQEDLEAALKAEQTAMDSLKAKLIADQERLQQTRTAQQTESEAIGRLERDVLQTRSELRSLERREQELSGRLQTTHREVERVGSRLKAREEGMARRLREMYKLGRRGPLQILFSSASFTDALKRLRYLSRVAEQDRNDTDAIREDRKRADKALALQRVQYRHQQTLLQGKRGSERSLEKRVTGRAQRLAKLKANAQAMGRAIRENEGAIAESNEKIQGFLKEIQEQLRRGRLAVLPVFDFEANRGGLLRPVVGPVVGRFGRHQDPELKTWTVNRGVNLAVPEGTEVRAVAPGEVVMVDWYVGYGQFVLLRHPDGFFTLYGHLESVLVNLEEILAEGAVLGTVGSTGRLDGKPQLHFEIMQGEEAQDPEAWLQK